MICATHATAPGTSTAMDPPEDAPSETVAGPAFVTRLTYAVALAMRSTSRCDQQPLRRLWLVTAATAQFRARARPRLWFRSADPCIRGTRPTSARRRSRGGCSRAVSTERRAASMRAPGRRPRSRCRPERECRRAPSTVCAGAINNQSSVDCERGGERRLWRRVIPWRRIDGVFRSLDVSELFASMAYCAPQHQR